MFKIKGRTIVIGYLVGSGGSSTHNRAIFETGTPSLDSIPGWYARERA